LLFEAAMHTDLSDVIVVYAPEHIQIKRLVQRDHLSEADALARVQSQMPIEEKKKRATFVIDNSGPIENTRKQTLDLFKRLKDRPA
jgi:dephospho-CoA kinase